MSNARRQQDAIAATVMSLSAGIQRYCSVSGLPIHAALRPAEIIACPPLGRRIAAAYDAAPIYHSSAKPAFRAFRDETWRQLDFLTRPKSKQGLGITVTISPDDPYPDSDGLLADLANQRLQVWATAAGTNPHPLLSEHDNDAFRAVHDAFGHGAAGRGFDAGGEEAAWWMQRQMYTPPARWALLTETRGQLNSLFYGNGGRFADQKAVLLPPSLGSLATLHVAPCTGSCQP